MGSPPREGGFLRSETGVRLLSALVLIAAALGAAVAGGIANAMFWLVVAGAALYEWASVTRLARADAMRAVLIGTLVAVSAALLAAPAAPLLPLGLGLAGFVAILLVARSSRDRLWASIGLAAALVLALVPAFVREHPALGLPGLLWIFAVVWFTDIAAYFTGRAFRGPKLWPAVSPGKTWSGAIGGLLGGTLTATLVAGLAAGLGWVPPIGWAGLVAIAILASIVGQGGDLAESALKRRFDVKDSSRIIPGHGGVLDRIDAFFAVCCLGAVALLAGAFG